MGTAEQLGVDAAATWLGTQNWSNGNVGMIVNHTTVQPWQLLSARTSHHNRATSGLIGAMELMYGIGSSEARALTVQHYAHGSYGIDGDLEDSGNMSRLHRRPATGGAAWA